MKVDEKASVEMEIAQTFEEMMFNDELYFSEIFHRNNVSVRFDLFVHLTVQVQVQAQGSN